MFSSRILLASAAILALGACATAGKPIGSEDPGFGEAARYNAALQTINPAPVYGPDAARPGDNGDKGASAVKRYRTDAVKPVETMETTAGTGTTSGSTPH